MKSKMVTQYLHSSIELSECYSLFTFGITSTQMAMQTRGIILYYKLSQHLMHYLRTCLCHCFTH